MQVKKIQIEGENIIKLHDKIIERWEPGYIYQDGNSYVYMHEEHYFRIKSNLLSVLIVKYVDDYQSEIEIITGGGSNEMDFDWGAEKNQNKNLIQEFIEISEENSWTVNGLNSAEYKKYKRKNIIDKVVEFLEK